MSYYEGVVLEYLRTDRHLFVNTELCIQLNESGPMVKGSHWYCDVVTADFEAKTMFLCEISYAKGLSALVKRLRNWNENWEGICGAIKRDTGCPASWKIRTWLFIPEDSVEFLVQRMKEIGGAKNPRFEPKITPLDMIQPWKYEWNRSKEHQKPEVVPIEMRV